MGIKHLKYTCTSYPKKAHYIPPRFVELVFHPICTTGPILDSRIGLVYYDLFKMITCLLVYLLYHLLVNYWLTHVMLSKMYSPGKGRIISIKVKT